MHEINVNDVAEFMEKMATALPNLKGII